MARIENITRETLIFLMAKYMMDCQKQMGERTNMELDIRLNNWGSNLKGKWYWSRTEIEFGHNIYVFTDKQIEDDNFIYMLNKALEKANGVRGKVYSQTYGDGCWTPKETRFERIEIYAKPCKEFKELNNMFTKYGSKEVGETDVFSVRVCGKRSSWSDSGKYYYLCYNAKRCATIMDDIRHNKPRGWKLSINVEDYFSHGDEEDYRCAQHMESEWYGQRGSKLKVTFYNSKGEKKYDKVYPA